MAIYYVKSMDQNVDHVTNRHLQSVSGSDYNPFTEQKLRENTPNPMILKNIIIFYKNWHGYRNIFGNM